MQTIRLVFDLKFIAISFETVMNHESAMQGMNKY